MNDTTMSFHPENNYNLSLHNLVNALQGKNSIFVKKAKCGKNVKMLQTKIYLWKTFKPTQI